jgi:hypothetical protein
LFPRLVGIDKIFRVGSERAAAHSWSLCASCLLLFAVRILSFHPKGLFDKRLVTLHRVFDSQEILFAVTIETDFADVFDSRFATVYGLESFISLCIVALYLDMIHLSLGEVPVSVFENVVADFDLGIAKKMFSSRVPVWIEEVLVQFDGLFGVPATSFVREYTSLSLNLAYRKSSSPSESIR